MSRLRILAVAPYEGLGEMIGSIAADRDDLSVDILVADLEDGLTLAKSKMAVKTYDAVISRGGTAELIAAAVDVPVISIDVSGYDFLRVITMAQNYAGKSAVIGFSNVTKNASVICTLLKADIKIYTIKHERQVNELVRAARDAGCTTIIGDNIAMRVTRKFGLNGVLITSGGESILKAFEDAATICRYLEHYRDQNKLFAALFARSDTDMLVLDGTETVYSTLSDKKEAALLRAVRAYENADAAQDTFRTILEIDNSAYRVSRASLRVSEKEYTLLRLKPVMPLTTAPEGVQFELGEPIPANPFSKYVFGDSAFGALLAKVKAVAKSDMPVMLCGAMGTGKTSVARTIHVTSARHAEMFVHIDCARVTTESWTHLFRESSSVFHADSGGSLYLSNLDELKPELQKSLLHLMADVPILRGWRLIAASEYDPALLAAAGFHAELLRRLSRFSISFPDLKDRPGAIDELLALYIGEANAKYGCEVVGINDNALAALKEYDWPYNIDQFREVIYEILLTSDKPYITLEQVAAALRQEKSRRGSKVVAPEKNKTLDELEAEIIQRVLKEESYNQSRAAARLGISRSTMWRKLKQFHL